MNAGYLRVAVAFWIVALVVGGYAESFPNRPSLEDMSECVEQGIICGNAVRERELAVNRSRSFLPYCGVWQPYIVLLQQELETLAPFYINSVSGPLNANHTSFLYFTLATWRAAAGLNASGFRRSVNGTTFVYGLAQVGDVISAWIFEDLQKGLGALKWTNANAYGTDLGFFGASASNYAGVVAKWPGLSWVPNADFPTFAAAWVDNYGAGPWDVIKHRGRLSFATLSIATLIDRVTLLGVVSRHPYGYPLSGEISEFGSFEAPGYEGEVLDLKEFEGPLLPDTVYSMSNFYGYSSLIVPDPGAMAPNTIRGWGLLKYGITKWNFTNQNP